MIAPKSDAPKLPAIVDLFAGCGGLGLGFKLAGFPIACSMDTNKSALLTGEYNLHDDLSVSVNDDIREADPLAKISKSRKDNLIVIGGPPCQSYSLAGRAKLRSLGEHRKHTNDKRGELFNDFLNVAIKAEAKAVVMENVPQAIKYGDQCIPEISCNILEKAGYRAIWTILNAADYGVPQHRNRMFVIAIRSEYGINPTIPAPTHFNQLKKGGSLKWNFKRFAEDFDHFVAPKISSKGSPWVTVSDALSDLPSIFASPTNKYQLHKPTELIPYGFLPKNKFQKIMRGSASSVSGHGFRKTLRDFPIFDQMKEGDNYLNASIIADQLLSKKIIQAGVDSSKDNERYALMRKRTVPPYDRTKFPDKWKRLHNSKTSHTLPAHLGTDTYSHIHPTEPRGITVREAARLQSFPDNFVFPCTMTDAFKQIGNAVPPLLGSAIANELKDQIKKYL